MAPHLQRQCLDDAYLFLLELAESTNVLVGICVIAAVIIFMVVICLCSCGRKKSKERVEASMMEGAYDMPADDVPAPEAEGSNGGCGCCC